MRVIAAAAFALAAMIPVRLVRPLPLMAQSLSSRPVVFDDPVPGRPTAGRELELGATTLTAAKRIFAVELQTDSVWVPRGFAGNPERVRAGTEWEIRGFILRPEQRLDLGPDHYALYFDGNQRLIGVHTARLPRLVMRDVLMAHYPEARIDRRMHSGDVAFDELVAPLGNCLALTATIRVSEDSVERLGYYYTCPTKP